MKWNFPFCVQSEFICAIDMTRTTSFGSVAAKIRPYMRFFFWLGQGPSPTVLRESSTKRKVFEVLPNTLFLLCDICLVTIGVVLAKSSRQGRKKWVTNLYIVTEFTTNIIILLQFAINKGILNKVVREFTAVAQLISSNFECHPKWDKLFKQIRMKMFWILLSHILSISLYLLPTMLVNKKLRMSLHFDAMQFTTAIGCMHGVLYINLLGFYMKTLNKTLMHYSASNGIHHTMGDGNEQFMFLKKMKMIHFRLWSIAQDINRFFGFGLGAILLRNFVDGTFEIYWAFLIIQNKRDTRALVQLIRTSIPSKFDIDLTRHFIDLITQIPYVDSSAQVWHQS